MPKILFPIQIYYPSLAGGPANTLYWQVAKLNQTPEFVTYVVTTNFGIAKWDSIQPNILLDFGYGKTKYIETKYPKLSLDFVFSSVKLLFDADIVHFPSLFFPPNFPIILIAKILGKQIIISPRGQLYKSSIQRKKMFKSIYMNILSVFLKGTFLHATNEIEKQQIRDHFKTNQIFVIPNFIQPPKRIFIKKKKQILFLGRINPIKGLQNLIEAIALCSVFNEHEFKLIIAGSSRLKYENEFEKKLRILINKLGIENKVIFKGDVRGVDKEILLAESHCLVLPSFSENFGNVVLESLNQGTPVIASKGTPWKILEDENCGWWVENSPDMLSLAITEAIELDEFDYKQYSANSIHLIQNSFDINNNIQKWREIYQGILTRRKT